MSKQIKILPIASGSSGNSMLISIDNHKLLIDMGVSLKRLKEALLVNSINIEEIDLAFLTHTHSDHIKGLANIAKYLTCPIYASELTANCLSEYKLEGLKYYQSEVINDDLKVTAFYTPHDAIGSAGFVFEYQNIKIGYATDLGQIDKTILEYLKGSDVIVLESNHDIEMLKRGPYPYYLKRRILSNEGHLANVDCAKAIKQLSNYGTKHFFLAHLSKENNTPECALRETKKELTEDINVCALPIYGTEMITINL